jgi:hypothetical protein
MSPRFCAAARKNRDGWRRGKRPRGGDGKPDGRQALISNSEFQISKTNPKPIAPNPKTAIRLGSWSLGEFGNSFVRQTQTKNLPSEPQF